MKTPKTKLLGSFPNWESETCRMLAVYERGVASRLPRGELQSQVFHRLGRIKIRDREHLARLIPRVVHQALIDFGRKQSRESALFVYDYAFDFPARTHDLPDDVQEKWEVLIGEESPLDDFEKSLIQVALEDPARFIRDGLPAQRALARYFGVDHMTIRNRWLRIVEKAASLQPPPDLSL